MNLEEMQSRCPDELASLRACAQQMWEKMTRGQKALLRMGMTDVAIHNEMVEIGFTDHQACALALYECAKRDGGMIA